MSLEETMAQDCKICPGALKAYQRGAEPPAVEVARSIFHDPCTTCDLGASSIDPSFCDVCRHLNLRHLLKYVSEKYLFMLRSDLIDEDFTTDCSCCLMVRHAIITGTTSELLSELRQMRVSICFSDFSSNTEAQAAVNVLHGKRDDRGNIQHNWTEHKISINEAKDDSPASGLDDPGVKDSPTEGVRPLVKDHVDWAYFIEAFRKCQLEHQSCRNDSPQVLIPNFRVIDVLERRLVEGIECQYVALSYVWGTMIGPETSQATTDTIDSLKKRNGVSMASMPATIEAAMKACEQIGERYLWVDRLCILQDDKEDKAAQMLHMDHIFARAQLTLIAEYGDSMRYGLAGVSRPRDLVQKTMNVDGLEITNLVGGIVGVDPHFVFHGRGWTYQESILSYRRLFFNKHQAHYECGAHTLYEDRFDTRPIKRREESWLRTSTRLVAPEEKTTFQSYMRHIMQYSRRRLTLWTDVYDAISGIMRPLYGEVPLLYGMPTADFHRALLWIAVDLSVRDKEDVPIDNWEDKDFPPSWSWPAAMCLNRHVNHDRPFHGALVTWMSSYHGMMLLPGETDKSLASPIGTGWEIAMAYACTHGCVEGIEMDLLPGSNSFAHIRDSFSQQWKEPVGVECVRDKSIAPHLLQTRWQRARLRLRPHPTHNHVIISPSGEMIGQIHGVILPSKKQFFENEWTPDATFEFGAISLRYATINWINDQEESKRLVDIEGTGLKNPPFVYVMMVKQAEDGIRKRLTLGGIYLTDWAKLEREWVDVILG